MHKQIGSTLITSLMFVLLISSLCLATSNSSAINSLLNQNITYSTQAYNNLQNTLDFAASTLAKNKHSEKVLDLSKTGKLYNSYKGESWPAENSFPGINASSEYIIEYLGCYPDTSIKIEACEDKKNEIPIHFYKITAKATETHTLALLDHKLIILTTKPKYS